MIEKTNASPKIMIVREDGPAADRLKETLQELEYAPCAAPCDSLRTIVDAAGESRPDLVLVDLGLEGEVDAVAVAEELGRLDLPVVYLTDGAGPGPLQRAGETRPFFGFVPEPVDRRQLQLSVETALVLHRREREHLEARSALEDAVEEQRGRMRVMDAVLDGVDAGVVAIDENGKYLAFNPAAESLFGSAEERVDMDDRPQAYGFFYPDRETPYPPEELPLRRALDGEYDSDVEIFVRTRDAAEGSFVSVSSRPLRGIEDGVRRSVITCRDVTRQKEAETNAHQVVNELRLEKRFKEAALDRLDEGVVFSDGTNRILYMNRTARRLFGTDVFTLDKALGERSERFGLFLPDRETLVPAEQLPLVRAVAGEEAPETEFFLRNQYHPDGLRITIRGYRISKQEDGSVGESAVAILKVLEGGEELTSAPPDREAREPEEIRAAMELTISGLRRKAELMETICDNIEDGIVVVDKEGRLVFANMATERIFGDWVAGPAPGKWSETFGIFYPEVKTFIPDEKLPIFRAIQGEKTEEMEMFVRNEKKREGVYISGHARPIFDSEGTEIIASLGVIRDITREKETEARLNHTAAELRDQTRLMETVFNTMGDGVVVIDNEGEVLLANPSIQRLFAMSEYLSDPESWSETYGIYHLDRETFFETENLPLVRALKGKITNDLELYVKNEATPHGSYITASAKPLKNSENGEILGSVGVVRDITKRKLAEMKLDETLDELRSQAELMEAVFDAMNEGVTVADSDGRFLLFNARAEEIVGKQFVDEDPANWPESYGAFYEDGETRVPFTELPVVRAIRGETVTDMEMFLRNENKPDGVRVSVSGRPLKLGRKKGAGLVVFRDITKQKEAESRLEHTITELENQAELMEAVFDDMDEGVTVADSTGRFLLFNARAEEIVGKALVDSDPSNWPESYGAFYEDGETRIPFTELPIIRAMRGETVTDMEMFLRNENKPDGVRVSVSGRPLQFGTEKVKAGLTVFRDVTGHKEAEARLEHTIAELENQAELMETVFNSISDGVVVADAEGNFTLFNPGAEQIVGLGGLEIPPDQWTDRYGLFFLDQKTHVPTEELPLVQAMMGQNVDDMEIFVRNEQKQDGVFLNVSARPLRKNIQGHGGGVAVFQDITKRKLAEAQLEKTMQELRNQNELMETTFNSISDGIVVADEKGNFLYVNPGAEQIVGMGATDAPQDEWGKEYGTFYPDRETMVKTEDLPLLRAIFQGESTDEEDLFLRNEKRPDGVYIRVSGRPLLHEVGGIRGGVIIFRDVTEQMIAEEALARAFAQGRLEIVDTILHNIGNAINSVTVGIETVQQSLANNQLVLRFRALAAAVEAHRDDWPGYISNDPQGQKVLPFVVALAADFDRQNDEQARTVERVKDRANRIADIVRTQKALGTPSMDRKDLNLESALQSAVRVLQDSAKKRGVEIEVDCSDAPAEIRIQDSQFHQMMVNLVKNAIEAIDELAASSGLREVPRIVMRAYEKEEFLHIDVTDNGIGIDKKNPKVLFTAGYTTKKSGSGLGLHSAANFVIGAGGQIVPLSEGPGKGTTMRIMMRLSSVIPPPPPTQPRA